MLKEVWKLNDGQAWMCYNLKWPLSLVVVYVFSSNRHQYLVTSWQLACDSRLQLKIWDALVMNLGKFTNTPWIMCTVKP